MIARTPARIARFAAFAACSLTLAATGAPPATTAAPPTLEKPTAADPGLESDLAILARLDRIAKAPFAFTDATAGEIVQAVRTATALPIEMDRNAMGDSGGWELKRLSCAATTPRAALDAVARAISNVVSAMRVDVASGIVVLTDESGSARLAARATYDSAPFTGLVSGVDDTERCARAIEFLAAQIDPDAWETNGGDAVDADCLGRQLAVTAPPAIHHEIRRALAAAREAAPPETILWRLRVLSCDDDADATAVLGALARGLPVEEQGVKTLSAPSVLARRDEPAAISIGSDAAKIDIEIVPVGAGTALATLRLTEGGNKAESSKAESSKAESSKAENANAETSNPETSNPETSNPETSNPETATAVISMTISPGTRALAATTLGGRTLVLEVSGTEPKAAAAE
ncbi:MAG: hypothetical protein RI967_1475 [Planctomycetota bacterium]